MTDYKFPLLQKQQIEVKVKKVEQSGAILLLYKTARTDMDILDTTVGPQNWTNDYREIKGNLYCGIAIRNDDEWIWKWDCGIESRSDGDGNEKKGEASDAFKRAGFRWGIGRELYTAPFVFATLPTEKHGAGFRLVGRPKFRVDEIAYQDDAISRLRIMCETRNTETEVFRFGMQGAPQRKSPSPAAQPTQPAQPTRIVQGQMDYIRAVCSEAEIQAILRKQKLERLEDMLFEKAKRVVEQLQQKGR